MSIDVALGGLVALCLFAYLLFALMWPEKF
jgi:K+-transporting ATPase KdpF subunit